MFRTHLGAVLFGALLFACNEDKPSTPARSTNASPASAAPTAANVAATTSAPAAVTVDASPATTAAPDAIAAQHILVTFKGAKGAPKGVSRSKADANNRAKEALAKARSGADFTALVAEYSEDPGSKDRLGNLGKFTREKMTKPFADAAFALGVNEISEVVETDFGFHVIKRNQ